MDDQFNGRTDDDLFADDFEPVAEPVAELVHELPPQAQPESTSTGVTETQPAQPVAPVAELSQPNPIPTGPRTLAHSRHAPKGAQQQQQQQQQHRPRKDAPKKPAPTSSSTSGAAPPPSTSGGDAEPTPPESSTTTDPAPASGLATAGTTTRPGSNTALADRLASGANPRTKLSETELAEKMEHMRILSAEKARKFEQAEQDSRSHALAYEKGMEEARRRRAEEAERRRRNEEERRQMDQERAVNRERKLKAMGVREGGWDEGKMTAEQEDGERRGFRGANGGIRGARSLRGGIDGSGGGGEGRIREFGADEFRGRGRGRGRGGSRGGGRGGRGGYAERNGAIGVPSHHQQQSQQQQPQKKPEQAPPTADDFPALPPSSVKLDISSTTTTAAAAAEATQPIPLPSPTPLGKWDDEMAALDEVKK